MKNVQKYAVRQAETRSRPVVCILIDIKRIVREAENESDIP